MPVIKVAPRPNPHPELVEELVRELELDRDQGPPDAPLVYEVRLPRANRLQVTVVWDRWNGISGEERGRVIMEAYQHARGEDEALTIGIALGLTPQEVERLGINPMAA